MTDTGRKNERETAVNVLYRVLEEGAFSHIELNAAFKRDGIAGGRERALVTRLCMGTLERLYLLDAVLDEFSKVKTAKMKPYIRTLMRMSAYQLLYLTQIPASAVCNEAVKLAKKRGFTGLSGFVNGVLRSIASDPERARGAAEPKGNGPKAVSLKYSMPEWLLTMWFARFGEETVLRILEAFYREKKVTVRCNESRIGISELKEKLSAEGVEAQNGLYVDGALVLNRVGAIEELETFRKGYFQIQDESSMLPVLAAGLKYNDRVIDLCAAPGGKALHAADRLLCLGGGSVEASDLSEAKAELIRENIERSGFRNITVLVRDARMKDEACRNSADVLLCDLPCSGLGIIGRKPEIKYRLKPEDLKELAALQRQILAASIGYVKPGGTLIYSTCTINEEENEGNVSWLLENGFAAEDIRPYLPQALRARASDGGYLQLLPGVDGTDGFFLARLTKKR